MKMRTKKDIHPGKKEKRMDARAEIGCCGLIFARTHTSTPPDTASFVRNSAVFPFQSGSVSFGRQGRFVIFAASLKGMPLSVTCGLFSCPLPITTKEAP
jgi:hypothetical protein